MRYSWCLVMVCVAGSAQAQERLAILEKGMVSFQTKGNQSAIPELYQLKPHQFSYELRKVKDFPLSGYEIHHWTFPSPVKSPYPENNTVHADYYKPKIKGPFPCVIVLHITGGDQSLSRMISAQLAQNGIGALFVQMAYYGPRRPQGKRVRLLSLDIDQTISGVQQTVLDVRRATAWMASRPEVDADNLGILGTSLGGFMAALSAEMEPKLNKVAILLAGGGFVDAYYDDPRAAPFRISWEMMGGNKEIFRRIIAPVDPITCAANLKQRKVLMLAAKKDEIVHPKMAEALWNASGRQKIVWFNAGHYTAALYIVPALKHTIEHFKRAADQRVGE